MTGVGNLGDVLQLVVDGLDNGPLAQQELVHQGLETRLHVLAQGGNQLETTRDQLFKER